MFCRKTLLVDLGVDERILLKWVSKKLCVMMWAGLNWLRIGSIGGAVMNTVISFQAPK
jgi:hypothetical protein